MNNKIAVFVFLIISILLVFYPLVSNLNDVQRLIDQGGFVTAAGLKARDNLILQILGFALLYVALFLGLDLIEFERNAPVILNSEPTEPRQTTIVKPHKAAKPLTGKTTNMIFVLSVSVFLLVFFWQLYSILPASASSINVPIFLIEKAMIGMIAALVIGILAYVIARYH